MSGPARGRWTALRDPATGQWRTIEGTEGFIVDWPAGEIADVPDQLERYEASFLLKYPNSSAEQLAYVVLYANDPTRNEGYVFSPWPRGRTVSVEHEGDSSRRRG